MSQLLVVLASLWRRPAKAILPFLPGKAASAGFTAFSSPTPLATSNARVIEANTKTVLLSYSTFLLGTGRKALDPPPIMYRSSVACMRLGHIYPLEAQSLGPRRAYLRTLRLQGDRSRRGS